MPWAALQGAFIDLPSSLLEAVPEARRKALLLNAGGGRLDLSAKALLEMFDPVVDRIVGMVDEVSFVRGE